MARIALSVLVALNLMATAGWTAAPKEELKTAGLNAETFAGLELRSIGPALMSGRIADVAIDPTDPSIWYVAVGSGGVWKTVNAGTTWTPLFDQEGAYSIGCVTVDPRDPSVIWVGTGENVGGRHVGFGDGVYLSLDGGASWKNVGLPRSEHISKIVVDPGDSRRVWVASQGPLWSPGGDRGLYLSTDRGGSWTKVLGGGEWTGVTDLVIDPRDPKVAVAATWQRQRSVAAHIDGGPESGLHKTTDGGLTWRRLSSGLPEEAMGKIGLAQSPQDPDVLYAAVELENRTGGVWRSSDRGESWSKRSDKVSGGTGPHYYQELYASPHAFDRIYLMDVRIQVSDDGGTSFRELTEGHKHSDNHSLAFRADDPDYLLAGTDGGLYESFDLARSWRFVANLPVTQFYKIAVDDSEPFYQVYGGTQDNSTQCGPSRTDSANGIRNADWSIVLGADGHQPAVEPGNPAIAYAEIQQGNLVRIDRTTGEGTYLQPQPEPGDPPERFNWDSPILVSPHSPTRLYYASQRIWRSDDRGDSWRPVSGDLTRGRDRMLEPLMGRVWSSSSAWDLDAMSAYGTITSLAESPLAEGLLWAGTDDGLLQVSGDGGASWRAIPVATLPGVPAEAFVNDVKADLFQADTVYVALDNHKRGDFKPYLVRSSDRGRTWRSIAGDLPDRHLVWRVVQDHVKPELLFAATELGLFFTPDGGGRWVELTGGVPTIAFRDLAIQRRENDLVAASFGRGLFILDDYAPLRAASEQSLAAEGTLFPLRRAWWYRERENLGGGGQADQGAGYFVAPNPPFGALFAYSLKEPLRSRKEQRRALEKSREAKGEDTPYPGWEELDKEAREEAPTVVLTVRDAQGEVVRRLTGPVTAGLHRVAWDLRYPEVKPVTGDKPNQEEEEWDPPTSILVAPGTYTVSLAKRVDGVLTELAGPVAFEVARLREGALPGMTPEQAVAFNRRFAEVDRAMRGASKALVAARERVKLIRQALDRSQVDPGGELDRQVRDLERRLADLGVALDGGGARKAIGEPVVPSVARRLEVAKPRNGGSTYGPTATHRRSLELAEAGFAEVRGKLAAILERELPDLEARLERAGVPWTPGRAVPAVGF